VRSKALVVAYAVHCSGQREVIGIDLGETESEAFWVAFLRSLVKRGLAGVRLAISDHPRGPKEGDRPDPGQPVAALHGRGGDNLRQFADLARSVAAEHLEALPLRGQPRAAAVGRHMSDGIVTE
jgi:Transposase, Mutator family